MSRVKAIWTWVKEWDGGWNSNSDEIIKEEIEIHSFIIEEGELKAVGIRYGKIKLIPADELEVGV